VSWIKGTSSDYIDLSNDIVAAVTATSLDTVAIDGTDASTGYVAGDILTIAGGTGTAATIEVVSVDGGGALTAVRIDSAGVYSAGPSTPNSPTGGTGSGAALAITSSTNGWTADRDTTWSGTERDVILHGTGGGSDTIYVGWRTYNVGASGRYNWELHGYTGYDSGLANQSQPGASPGAHDSGDSATRKGTYLLLKNGPMNWWLSVTPFRIILMVKVDSNFYPMYLGFINRYATTTEYPYPLMVAGAAPEYDATHNQATTFSSLTDPWAEVDVGDGPMRLIDAAGTWNSFANATFTGADINPSGKYITLPCGSLQDSSSAPLEDRFTAHSLSFSFDHIVNMDTISAPTANLEPTPGTGADYYVLFPTMLLHSETANDQQVYGELDDVFWFQAYSTTTAPTSEDRIIQGDVYRVFKNCNRTGIHSFLAIKEG
jgi:hypothetical protein